MNPPIPSAGYLFAAFGHAYILEAAAAAVALKKVHPEAHVTVVTDGDVAAGGCFDLVISQSAAASVDVFRPGDTARYYVKIAALSASPYEKTIFLDTDAHVVNPVDELFMALDHFDLLITPSYRVYEFAFEALEEPFRSIPGCFETINTGVLAYRRTKVVQDLFREWERVHHEMVSSRTTNDQSALRLALYQSQVRFYLLSERYNFHAGKALLIPSGGRVCVVHSRNPWLQRWGGKFRAFDGPLVVGRIGWRFQAAVQLSRVLFWIQRQWRRISGRRSKT